MEKPFFVMLRHPGGKYILPLIEGDDAAIMQFSTEEEAREAAQGSWLGSEVGYEIFNFDEGL